MRLLGVLGGMSWVSSMDLYGRINRGVADRLGGLHSARLLLHSVDFAPIAALQTAQDWPAAGRHLGAAAAGLRAAGAQGLLLATNTMHQVADAIEAQGGLPLLHVVDITAAALRARSVRTVGLLGTRFTMELPLYAERMARHGLALRVPDAAGRAAVHEAIYTELCHNRVTPATTALLIEQVMRLDDHHRSRCFERNATLDADDRIAHVHITSDTPEGATLIKHTYCIDRRHTRAIDCHGMSGFEAKYDTFMVRWIWLWELR
jgi:aspartate racemase